MNPTSSTETPKASKKESDEFLSPDSPEAVPVFPTDLIGDMPLSSDVLEWNRRMLDAIEKDHNVVSEMFVDDNGEHAWRIYNVDNALAAGGSFFFLEEGTLEREPRKNGGVWRPPTTNGGKDDPTPGKGSGKRDRVPATPDADLVPTVEAWLRERFPEIDEYSFNGNAIVYGRVQQGKTELILGLIWVAQQVHHKVCVLALANMTGSYNQVLGKNATEFNRMLRSRFGDACPVLHTTGFRSTPPTGEETGHDYIRVLMGNPAQLRRVLEDVKEKEYLLFIDEADVSVKGVDGGTDASKSGPLFEELRAGAVGVVEITATPFALFNQKTEQTKKTILMSARPTYRGFRETQWRFVEEATAKQIRNGSAPKALHLLKEILRARLPVVREAPSQRYMTVLINGPSTIARQEALAKSIASREKKIGVFVMNSGAGCLLKRAGSRGKMVPLEMESVSMLYDAFEAEARRRPEVFRVYVIVACLTASRAISFRPTTPRIGKGGLHAMILLPAATAHTAQLIQFMRIWGNYDKDYPEILCATTRAIHDRLDAEIHHNLEALAGRTRELGICRERIEGAVMIDTKRHDRRAVDDTILTDKKRFQKYEFDTLGQVQDFVKNFYTNKVIMTENFHQVVVAGRPDSDASKKRMREETLQALGKDPKKIRLNVSWGESRYEELHDMKYRFQGVKNDRYNSQFVGGYFGDDCIRVVIWKPGFSDKVQRLDDLREDTAYLFQTTRGTWRFFNPGEGRAIGVLTHPED